jgi:Subtilase family
MANDFPIPANSIVLTSSVSKLRMLKEQFSILKVYDKSKDIDFLMAFDKDKKQVDFEAILKQENELYNQKFGKIHPSLFSVIEKTDANTPIKVMVWLKIDDNEPQKTAIKANELDKIITDFRKLKSLEINQIANRIADDTGVKINTISKLVPAFFTEIKKDKIKRLSDNQLVVGILLHNIEGIDDLSNSMAISNADDVVASGFTGKDIKVAVWEGGPDDTSNLVIQQFKDAGNRTSDHARLVCGVIKNIDKDKPHGYAPDCKLFSANDQSIDGLEWAVKDKGCSVINQSFHRSEEQTDGDLSSDDIHKDFMIYHYPYPTIIQAAGNTGQANDTLGLGEFVNHKGFNSLAIGSHDDAAGGMASSSTFKNPDCPHGDRELPELSANGTAVSAVGLTKGGTSFASPAVVGSVALLQSVSSTLKIWPEGSRAILLAGATKNVRGDNWNTDRINGVDARDGSGALDIGESVSITQNRKSKNNTASQRGWDIGRLDSGDFRKNKNSKASYKIKVPNDGAKHIKVALAWNSKVDDLWFAPIHISSKLKLDLDLWIFDEDNNVVARSSSFDNSYEIAEFDAKPGKEYTIKIRKFSGDDWTYFGIAWTVF